MAITCVYIDIFRIFNADLVISAQNSPRNIFYKLYIQIDNILISALKIKTRYSHYVRKFF